MLSQVAVGSDNAHTLAAATTYANTLREAAAADPAGERGYSLAYNLSIDTVNATPVVLKVHQRCNLACEYCYVYTKPD